MPKSLLLALPPSIKRRVVQLIAWQDEAYHSRIARIKLPHITEDDAWSMEAQGGGEALSAVALVNKELRALAAEHQFKVRFSTCLLG